MWLRLLSATFLFSHALLLHAEDVQRPNVLLLMAEDMSARVGIFGDAIAHTPNLDRLAGQGVMYTNTFTTAGVCAPSRAAHILGVHQISSGSQHMRTGGGPNGGYTAVPPPGIKAYPELLRAAGYYTYTDTKLDYQFSGTLWNSGPSTIWDGEGRDTHWRNREPGRPFYGLVNFPVTHESGVFRPLGSWPNSITHFVMQMMRALQVPEGGAAQPTSAQQVVLPPYYPDTPTVRIDVARHYDNIAVMDAQVGTLLAELEADGLADSTIVIWTTDHGDGLPRAKRELYDSGIRVPMIIRWPERFRPEGVAVGTIERRLVSFVDFAPTILRLAGVDRPGYLQGKDFIEGPPRRYIYASRDRIDEVPDRQRAVSDGRYKYIRSWQPQQPGGHRLKFRDNIDMVREMRTMYEAGELTAQQAQWFEAPGEERLFDTREDPWELTNLVEDPRQANVLQRMRGALEAWLANVSDLGELPEVELAESFWPGGEQPVTDAPSLRISKTQVVIEAPGQASIEYSIDEGPWRVYAGPFKAASGALVAAKAVRYGWKHSELVEFKVP